MFIKSSGVYIIWVKGNNNVFFILEIFIHAYNFPTNYRFLNHRYMPLISLWAIPQPHIIRIYKPTDNI